MSAPMRTHRLDTEGAASVATESNKRFKRVYVLWIDSCSPSDSSWHKASELSLSPLKCDTLGWLVHEDKQSISVASCVMENGALYGVITIPKCSILKRR